MDRLDENETHHQEEQKKDEPTQHEWSQKERVRTIQPSWIVMVGVVLIAFVVMLWTFM